MSNSWRMIVVIGVFLCLPWSVWAALTVESRIEIREEYTDNFGLLEDNEESDFITSVIPGISLGYRAQLLELDFDYALHFLKTLHHKNEDETSLRDVQRFFLTGLFFPDQDFNIRVVNSYERVVIDNRRQVDEENLFVNKSNLYFLKVNPEYCLKRFNSFEPTLGYFFQKYSYQDQEGHDSDSHTLYLRLHKEINSIFSLIVGSSQEFFHEDLGEDYERFDLTAGLEYHITSALNLRLVGGKSWLNYEERGNSQSELWDVQLDYQTGSRWRVGLAYKEGYNLSVNRGTSHSRRLEGIFDYLEAFPTTLIVYADKLDYEVENTEDRALGGGLNISIPFSNQLKLEFTGNLERVRFLPESENAWRYGVGLAANYRMKIMDLTAGYRYRISESDVDENDYRNNLIYLQAALRFGDKR